MTPQELIQKYLAFFVAHGHRVIAGSSLVPENDPSALFISAGMHPLVPYLLGEPHPAGQRLVDVQKCLRTDDIDNVGDGFHHTFFLMLGNWSLGDYFKDEAIAMSFEFLTSPAATGGLGIDPSRLYVTVFAGDVDSPRDEESIAIWQREFAKAGIKAEIGERIFPLGKKDNWWGPVGETGPCGPDSEMFFDTGKAACGPNCQPGCGCGKYVEIWNNVFMEFNRQKDGSYLPLKQKNVDTGMGVDRTTAILSGFGDDDYRTEFFWPVIEKIEEISGKSYGRAIGGEGTDPEILGSVPFDAVPSEVRSFRIIADHLRAAVFMIADGVMPSNVDRGYIVRRLIRRAIRHGRLLGISARFTDGLGQTIVESYQELFPELVERQEALISELKIEEERFGETLDRGLKVFEKLVAGKEGVIALDAIISGVEAFDLYQTYGFPLELTEELAHEKKLTVDNAGFRQAFEIHQAKSREGLEKKFKGGLVDHSEIATKYHTATHLLHAALRQILGDHVQQKGSNITSERMRFDFSHSEKMTDEQLKQVEALVNRKIQENLPVQMAMMSLEEAKAQGALAFFAEKYGEQVKVFSVGSFSKEVCGGPHVAATGELGEFKILKEESVGRGVRRIKAVLNPS